MRSLRVIGVRPHLIGDCLMATVIPPYIKRRYEDTYVNWVVAAKCAQAAPLWFNHPSIDRLLIAQGDAYQGLEAEVERCGVVFDPLPQHPDGDAWVNQPNRTIYSETWLMAGLPLSEYDALPKDQQVPHLVQWFPLTRRPKAIAIWPGARQGEKENRRNPPYHWWRDLCTDLTLDGYTIYQCGHPNDLKGEPLLGIDVRAQSFMDLIRLSLECDLVIGTDSGSMIALAAYHSTPTLSLLSPHWPGHVANPLAFGPLGARHTNLWASSNTTHSVDTVLTTVHQILS